MYFSPYGTGQSVGGVKTGEPREKHLAHLQAELGLPHMCPVWGSNTPGVTSHSGEMIEWLSVVMKYHHSATGTAFCDPCILVLYGRGMQTMMRICIVCCSCACLSNYRHFVVRSDDFVVSNSYLVMRLSDMYTCKHSTGYICPVSV